MGSKNGRACVRCHAAYNTAEAPTKYSIFAILLAVLGAPVALYGLMMIAGRPVDGIAVAVMGGGLSIGALIWGDSPVCPMCESRDSVPAESPRGQRLLGEDQ